MTEFIAAEIQRILDRLPTVDPATTDYHILLQSLECFIGICDTIEEAQEQIGAEGKIVKVEVRLPKGGPRPAEVIKAELAEHPPEDESPFPEVVSFKELASKETTKPEGYDEEFKDEEQWQAEAKEKPAKTYEMTDVRAALVEARKRGVNVAALLREFGVENFGAFPAGKYGELMKKLGES